MTNATLELLIDHSILTETAGIGLDTFEKKLVRVSGMTTLDSRASTATEIHQCGLNSHRRTTGNPATTPFITFLRAQSDRWTRSRRLHRAIRRAWWNTSAVKTHRRIRFLVHQDRNTLRIQSTMPFSFACSRSSSPLSSQSPSQAEHLSSRMSA